MTASNVHVQGNSRLYSRGKELYLTQIYYSVFDQLEQGLPLDAHYSAFCWLAFFLSIEDVLSLSCPERHDGNCLLELSTQEDRDSVSEKWIRKLIGHVTQFTPSTILKRFIMIMIDVMVWQSISHLLVGNEGLAYLFLIAMCPETSFWFI